MNNEHDISKYKYLWLILILSMGMLIALVVEYYLPAPKSGPFIEPTGALKLAIESFTSLRELLLSWSFGVVAGIAFFLKANLESGLKLEKQVFVTLMISAMLVVTSFFFGHLVLDRLALFLARDLNPFKDDILYILGLLQYTFLLLSIISIIYAMALIYIPRITK